MIIALTIAVILLFLTCWYLLGETQRLYGLANRDANNHDELAQRVKTLEDQVWALERGIEI